MSAHVTAEFDALLTKAQDLSFIEERDSLETQYTKFTKPGDASEHDYRSVSGARPGVAVYTPELSPFYESRYIEGTELVISFKTYTVGVMTSWQVLADMQNNTRVRKQQFRYFQDMNKDLTKSLNDAREIIAADFLIRADSTTATNSWQGTGRDGYALASASHTLLNFGTAQSNYPSGDAMTYLTLKDAITILRNQLDENGNPMSGVKNVGIMCGPYWEWQASEILNAMLQPHTTDVNTPNALRSEYSGINYTLIVNRWVGSSEKGWMVFDMDSHRMYFFEKDKPFFGKSIDPRTDARINKGTWRGGVGFDSWKGVVFNPGP